MDDPVFYSRTIPIETQDGKAFYFASRHSQQVPMKRQLENMWVIIRRIFFDLLKVGTIQGVSEESQQYGAVEDCQHQHTYFTCVVRSRREDGEKINKLNFKQKNKWQKRQNQNYNYRLAVSHKLNICVKLSVLNLKRTNSNYP